MKSILEIPIFSTDPEFFKPFIESVPGIIEKHYGSAYIFQYAIDKQHSFLCYLLDEVPERGNQLYIDQVIAKAPFSFLLVGNEVFSDTATGSLFKKYSENYETPMCVLVSSHNEDLQNKLSADKLFEKYEPEIILHSADNSTVLRDTILEAIKVTTPLLSQEPQ